MGSIVINQVCIYVNNIYTLTSMFLGNTRKVNLHLPTPLHQSLHGLVACHTGQSWTTRQSLIGNHMHIYIHTYIHTFKVCKSAHHRTIHINHQPDATVFQFIILTFIYSSTCFGRCPAHHQELDCSGSLWFYLRIVVTVVLCSWSSRRSPRYEGKTRGCHCSH